MPTPDDRFRRQRPTGASSASDLRLALFTDTFAPQVNGVARTLLRLTETVRSAGGQVLVVTTSDPRAARDGRIERGTERWASAPFWKYDELRLAAPSGARARRALRDFRPTLVHAATPFGVGMAGRATARSLGIPLVTSYHTSFTAYCAHYGLGALAGAGWHFLRWFHNGGQRTFCPTRAVQRELEAQGFAGLSVWGRGVDMERFSPRYRDDALRARLGAGRGDVVVAYVGRLAAEKGLVLAMAAVRRAQELLGGCTAMPRLVFALAGDGPMEAECRRTAPPGTAFAGRLEGNALGAFFASADVFLFPSRTDTFGNVLLEAMASRLAIVAADAPPTRELLGVDGVLGGDDGDASDHARGIITPPDADSLGQALAELVSDPGRREQFAARAYAHAAGRSWTVVFDRLLADYHDVMRAAA